MRKAHAIILAGLGAVSLVGAATAAGQKTHTVAVPLPDGSLARIEYVGDVAPKVTVDPAPLAGMITPFGMFDRTAAEMRRQIDSMLREMTVRPIAGTPGMNVAAYGDMPAGSTSMTVVSTSNGSKACTRTTEVTSQGPGKPPKVRTDVSGDCTPAPAAQGRPITRT
jgi:hypothetical protein